MQNFLFIVFYSFSDDRSSGLISESRQDLTSDVHCCHIGTAIKHPVTDRIKPSFVIFDIRALWRSGGASECPDVKNYKWRLTYCLVQAAL